MSDQCKNCSVRGDYKKCITTECFRHESWIDIQRIKKIAKLENLVKHASKFFSPLDSFGGEKQDWLKNAEIITNEPKISEDPRKCCSYCFYVKCRGWKDNGKGGCLKFLTGGNH